MMCTKGHKMMKNLSSRHLDGNEAPGIHTDNRLSLGDCTEMNLASGTFSLLGS
jgi:hypothetical protein